MMGCILQHCLGLRPGSASIPARAWFMFLSLSRMDPEEAQMDPVIHEEPGLSQAVTHRVR